MKPNVPDNYSISSEELQRLHRGWVEGGDCILLLAFTYSSCEKDSPELSSEVASSTMRRWGLLKTVSEVLLDIMSVKFRTISLSAR